MEISGWATNAHDSRGQPVRTMASCAGPLSSHDHFTLKWWLEAGPDGLVLGTVVEGVNKEVASSVSSNKSYRYRWLLKRNWSYQRTDAIEFIASVILQWATRPKITPPPSVMSAGLFRVSFSSCHRFLESLLDSSERLFASISDSSTTGQNKNK